MSGARTGGTEPRCCDWPLPEDRVAHRIQETAGLLVLFAAERRLHLLDAVVGALERLVLHQRGLHQRIDAVRCLAQAMHDRRHRLGITRRIFQFCEPVEKIVDQLAFLRGHAVLHRVGASQRDKDVGPPLCRQ